MAISYDQYKVETCSITDDECCGGYCTHCETAIEHQKVEREEYIERNKLNYLKFDSICNICGLSVRINDANTIAITDVDTLNLLYEKGDQFPKTEAAYNPTSLKEYPEFFKLKKYAGLGIPDQIFADKHKPAVVRYGDKYYMIAPRFEDGE